MLNRSTATTKRIVFDVRMAMRVANCSGSSTRMSNQAIAVHPLALIPQS